MPRRHNKRIWRDLRKAGAISKSLPFKRWSGNVRMLRSVDTSLSYRRCALSSLLADYFSDDCHATGEGVVLKSLGIRYGGTLKYHVPVPRSISDIRGNEE